MNYLSIRLYVIHNHQLCCGLISCFLDFFQSFFSVYFSAGLVSDAVLQFTSLLGQLLFFLDFDNFAVLCPHWRIFLVQCNYFAAGQGQNHLFSPMRWFGQKNFLTSTLKY